MGFPGSGHCLSYITQLSIPHVHRVNSPRDGGRGCVDPTQLCGVICEDEGPINFSNFLKYAYRYTFSRGSPTSSLG